MQKKKILVVNSDLTGVGYFRSLNPHIKLEELYPDEFSIEIDSKPDVTNPDYFKRFDLLHFHRSLGPYELMEQTLKILKDLNIPAIMDIDDYWDPGMHHPAYYLIKNSGMAKKVEANLKMVDYVTTTSDIFKKEINKFCKNVFVIPNAIDPTEKQYIPNPELSNRLRFGYLAGSSHLKDLQLLDGVMSQLKSDGLQDKMQFVLCGFDTRGTTSEINKETGQVVGQRNITPMESVWFQYEQIVTDNYKTVSDNYRKHLLNFSTDEFSDISNEAYRRVWTKHISSYATNYNLFDVSIAPLAEHKFNQNKSNLKVSEAGFHKKALIAQDFGPYKHDLINAINKGGTINPNGNALLVDSYKNHKQWYQYMKKLIKEPGLVEQLQTNLYETVKDTYSIEAVSKQRRELYNKILNK